MKNHASVQLPHSVLKLLLGDPLTASHFSPGGQPDLFMVEPATITTDDAGEVHIQTGIKPTIYLQENKEDFEEMLQKFGYKKLGTKKNEKEIWANNQRKIPIEVR